MQFSFYGCNQKFQQRQGELKLTGFVCGNIKIAQNGIPVIFHRSSKAPPCFKEPAVMLLPFDGHRAAVPVSKSQDVGAAAFFGKNSAGPGCPWRS